MPIYSIRSLLFAGLVLSGCSGGSTNAPMLNLPDDIIQPGRTDEQDRVQQDSDNGLLPNFTISNFAGTSVYTGQFTWQATVTNTGNGAGELPGSGLLLESVTSDFSTGSGISYYSVVRKDQVESRVMLPGESTEITGYNTITNYSKLRGLSSTGPIYAKFWINPDYGKAVFFNPADGDNQYKSIRFAEESEYEDNISNAIVIEKERYDDAPWCINADLENNDSLDEAQPILLGIKYESNFCEDSTDVFVISLNAGADYEVIPDGFDFENAYIQRLLIISPENNYVVDKIGVRAIFTAPTSGEYKVVITTPYGEDHNYSNDGFFTIIEQ